MSAAATRQRRAGDVAQMLAANIFALAICLLPDGKRHGAEWICSSAASPFGCSVSVHLVGPKAGIWSAWSAGTSGDALDLVASCLHLTIAEALTWSRKWLGIAEGNAETKQHQKLLPVSRPADTEAADRQARALDIWRSAVESIIGTPAEMYVRSRGLDPARLCSLWGPGQWPATLRYTERAHSDPARECRALVVAIHGANCGLVRAIHRILLAPDGTSIRDQRGRRVKLALGPVAGNAARFDYGPDYDGRWGIAEGVESALCAYQLTGIPTWAAISAGNIKNVAPPAWARHVTIFADRDVPGESAAAAALRQFRDLADIESVRIIAPIEEGSDAADMVREQS